MKQVDLKIEKTQIKKSHSHRFDEGFEEEEAINTEYVNDRPQYHQIDEVLYKKNEDGLFEEVDETTTDKVDKEEYLD